MSKRFTDSSKFRDPWYRKLSPKMKCLWEYLISECDLAGILEFDMDSMSFHIGEKITIDDLIEFGDRVYFLSESKIFIPKFVSFQQGVLNPDNKAHKSIFIAFEKYNIPTDLNMDNFVSPFNPPSKGDKSPTGIGNSKGIGNSIVNIEKNENFYENDFEEFWKSYQPYEVTKGSKQDARKEYIKAIKDSPHESIMDGLKKYMDYCHSTGCKTKQAFRWISKKGWLDDYTFESKKPQIDEADAAIERAKQRVREMEAMNGQDGTHKQLC